MTITIAITIVSIILITLSRSIVIVNLHSAKGGAVETGCSDLYDAIY